MLLKIVILGELKYGKRIHNVFSLMGLQYEDHSKMNCHAEEHKRSLYYFFPENSPLN